MYVCPICHAIVNNRATHLDWHAARSTAEVRRRRPLLDPIPDGQTIDVTVTWPEPMPDDAYEVAWAVETEWLGVIDVEITDRTTTGCTVHLTPHIDQGDAVLDLTAHYPVEATPDGP